MHALNWNERYTSSRHHGLHHGVASCIPFAALSWPTQFSLCPMSPCTYAVYTLALELKCIQVPTPNNEPPHPDTPPNDEYSQHSSGNIHYRAVGRAMLRGRG